MAACREKVAHPSREEAEQHARLILARGLDTEPGRPLRPYPCPRCLKWHVGHGPDLVVAPFPVPKGGDVHIDQTRLEAEVTAALRRDDKATVLIVGGPAGFFDVKLERHPRVSHHVSTETRGNDQGWLLPAHAGVVLLTKFVSRDLARSVVDQCHRANIGLFGPLNSPGAVNRALKFLLTPPPAERRTDLDDPAFKTAFKQEWDRDLARLEAEEAAQPSLLKAAIPTAPAVEDVEAIFKELEVYLALAKEAVLAATKEAEALRVENGTMRAEAEMLRQLRELLRVKE